MMVIVIVFMMCANICRTANNQGITRIISEVKTDLISTQTINFVEGVKVLPPILFHNKSIDISELVVLSLIPDAKCILTSVFLNQSQRELTKTGIISIVTYHRYSQNINFIRIFDWLVNVILLVNVVHFHTLCCNTSPYPMLLVLL